MRFFAVLYACEGCVEFGQIAREVGAHLDRSGVAEMVWLGASAGAKPKSRYPIVALEGCDKACAQRWLARHGERPIAVMWLRGRPADPQSQ